MGFPNVRQPTGCWVFDVGCSHPHNPLDTSHAFPHGRSPMTQPRTMQSPMTPAYAGWVVVFACLRGSLGINVNANKRHDHPQGCFPMTD